MNSQKSLRQKRARRVKRVRAKIIGTAERPRLAVFRSNRYIYAQLIDDGKGKTVAAASSRELREKERKGTKVEGACAMGERVAKKALEAGISRAVFDRRSYAHHGQVRAVVEGARKAGLKI